MLSRLDKLVEPKLFARFGDADDYHEIGDYLEFSDALKEHGITGPLTRYTKFGLEAPGYTGHNYISAYYGSDVETPVRELTDAELAYVNAEIQDVDTDTDTD